MTSVIVAGFGFSAVPDDLPSSMEGDALPLVGLYLSPWEAFLARAPGCDAGACNSDDWTADWLAWHRELLGLYDSAPDRVHLVNAGRLSSVDTLAGYLADHDLSLPGDIELKPLALQDVPVARILAAAMAEFDRPLWEQYQALEASAVLLGREPEFLGAADLPDLARGQALLHALREVQTVALASAEEKARQANDDKRRENQDVETLLSELRQENELLGIQLQQLHEELHFQVESGRQLRHVLADAERVATSARLLISSLAARNIAPG